MQESDTQANPISKFSEHFSTLTHRKQRRTSLLLCRRIDEGLWHKTCCNNTIKTTFAVESALVWVKAEHVTGAERVRCKKLPVLW